MSKNNFVTGESEKERSDSTRAVCGLILRGTLEDFAAAKELLTSRFDSLVVVYQKISAGKLIIKEG